MRARIGLLTAENGDLKQKLAGAELDIKGAAAARATLAEELSRQQNMLRNAQVRHAWISKIGPSRLK